MRIEKVNTSAVLKAMVLRVAMIVELLNARCVCASAWAKPQSSAVLRISSQWWLSQRLSAAGVCSSGRRWSRRSASSRAKMAMPINPIGSCCSGLLLNPHVSSQASR